MDWDGERAPGSAGVYARDWPGTCYADGGCAAVLGANPSTETLREFVSCAEAVVESDAYFATSRRIPELLFDGRNALEAGAPFEETSWYYNFNNSMTGDDDAKVAFYRLVRAQGVPLLIGSGYNP